MNKFKDKIQNEQSEVENIAPRIIDEVVKKSVTEIYESVIGYENIEAIADEIIELQIAELYNQSFMTQQLELTEKQKEVLKGCAHKLKTQAVGKYIQNINVDKRTKAIAIRISEKCNLIAERVMSGIAREVNRGAIISCTAVKADAKNEKQDTIELVKSKFAGDVTIPTRALLISTNCVDIIKKSCVVKGFEKSCNDKIED